MNPQLDVQLRSWLLQQSQQDYSDLHLEASPEGYCWRGRLTGSLKVLEHCDTQQGLRQLAALKAAAGMDITERRKPQDGRLSLRTAEGALDCRLNTLPTLYGEKLVLRLLPPAAEALALEQLGLTTGQQQQVQQALSYQHGLILATGATGSGKTRTLYAMLQQLRDDRKNISTVEDPVEISLPGVNQVNVNQGAGLTFASALRALLRQDPDILMVGEIRDQETARMCCQAAQTGHLVLATLHANHAASAIIRLQQLGVSPYELATCLQLVSHQELHRTVQGRTGLFQIHLVDEPLQQALLSERQQSYWPLLQPTAA